MQIIFTYENLEFSAIIVNMDELALIYFINSILLYASYIILHYSF